MTKKELITTVKTNKDIISDHSVDISTLIRARTIANKLDRGEDVSDEENKIFRNIKEDYGNYFGDEDVTNKGNLEKAISYFEDAKKSLIHENRELKKVIKTNKLDIPETIVEEKEETNIEITKKHTHSRDFKQDTSDVTSAGEPMDFMDPDS